MSTAEKDDKWVRIALTAPRPAGFASRAIAAPIDETALPAPHKPQTAPGILIPSYISFCKAAWRSMFPFFVAEHCQDAGTVKHMMLGTVYSNIVLLCNDAENFVKGSYLDPSSSEGPPDLSPDLELQCGQPETKNASRPDPVAEQPIWGGKRFGCITDHRHTWNARSLCSQTAL